MAVHSLSSATLRSNIPIATQPLRIHSGRISHRQSRHLILLQCWNKAVKIQEFKIAAHASLQDKQKASCHEIRGSILVPSTASLLANFEEALMSEARTPLIMSVFCTFAVGGPQVRFTTLANRLGSVFRHAVIAMDGDFSCAERLAPGLDIAFPRVEIRKGETLANALRFRRALRAIRPDVLVTNDWGTIEWALANVAWPVVRHIHIEDGFGPEDPEGLILRRVLMRRAVLWRPSLVVPSRTLWRIVKETWRLPEERLRYVPNGVDLSRFAPRADPCPSDRQAVTIGTVAALRAVKNLSRLLRAFRLLPGEVRARLVIVGDGPERGPLEAMAAELGLSTKVQFAGPATEPAPFLRQFDIFALSSDTEQMPLSVLEAMAAGLPVATTDVGDLRVMLSAENAPFVVPKDDIAFAAAIRQLAEDAPLRARVGIANRAKAERDYDENVMVEAYRALFQGAAT